MPDHIRYDLLTQQALRGVVRNVLSEAAKKGLPGEHHFYVSFDTQAEGVRLSDRLKAQYPEQMTIILQHQFWDLEVDEDSFSVGLSFGGVPEKLHVPFEAIKGFFDPSVQFGLQFEEVGDTDAQPVAGNALKEAAKDGGKEGPKPAAPAVKKKAPSAAPLSPKAAAPAPAPAASETAGKPDDPDKPSGGAEVVRLDRFRKK
jgi:hypothetical protein